MSQLHNCSGSTVPGWQKILWQEQPYPDNHVGDSFLQDLVVNARVPSRRWSRVALDAVAISLQLSLVAASVLVPWYLACGTLSAPALLAVDAALLLIGYLVCALLGGHLLGGSLARGVRQAGLLVGGVYFLAPLLATLTATVSEDSVVALCGAALLLHLFLHDYHFVNAVTQRLSGAVALAAAALSAVLIASLMPSELHVFAQVLFSLELFLLSPFVWRYVRAASLTAHVAVACVLATSTAAAAAPLSRGLAAAYATAHVLLTLACPALLVRIRKVKAHITGPWDEAVPPPPEPPPPPPVGAEERRRAGAAAATGPAGHAKAE